MNIDNSLISSSKGGGETARRRVRVRKAAANMATEERRVAIMKGYFGLIPDFAGAPYNEYFARLQAQPSTVGAGPGACDTAVDDDSPATFIWQQDHDNNLSTPLECGGFDFTLPDTCVQD